MEKFEVIIVTDAQVKYRHGCVYAADGQSAIRKFYTELKKYSNIEGVPLIMRARPV